MAIDTTALNKLITHFRALSQKDSVSPESLGSLLQKLADLLASCPADSEVSNALNSVNRTITSLQSDLQNIARSAVTTDELSKALKGKADDFAYYVDKDTIEFRPGTLKVASQQIAMAIADIVNSNKLRDKNIEAKADTAELHVVLASMGVTLDNLDSTGDSAIMYVGSVGDIYYSEGKEHLFFKKSETETIDLGEPNDKKIYANAMTKRLYIWRGGKWQQCGGGATQIDAYMIAKQNGYEGTAEEFYQGFNNNERGVIYLDINDSTKLRVLGAERYLNDEYVPFIFRKTRKANTYKVKKNGELTRYHEKTRKGWHPMGQIGQCAVDKNGVVSVRKDVFKNGESKEMSTLPEYFVQEGWLVCGAGQEGGPKTTVPYGRSRIDLEKECVQDETTGMMRTKWRRVRLLYGIAFIKKKYVDKVKRLDLSQLATNIATFHLCWDGTQYVPEGNLEEWSDNFHWIFNK